MFPVIISGMFCTVYEIGYLRECLRDRRQCHCYDISLYSENHLFNGTVGAIRAAVGIDNVDTGAWGRRTSVSLCGNSCMIRLNVNQHLMRFGLNRDSLVPFCVTEDACACPQLGVRTQPAIEVLSLLSTKCL